VLPLITTFAWPAWAAQLVAAAGRIVADPPVVFGVLAGAAVCAVALLRRARARPRPGDPSA
jgi:hypothetical protein